MRSVEHRSGISSAIVFVNWFRELGQLFVVLARTLNVPREYAVRPGVAGGVAAQLQHLGSEVLEHGRAKRFGLGFHRSDFRQVFQAISARVAFAGY